MRKKNKVTVDADLESIMPRYLEIRAEELIKIQAALADRDAETIAFLGHRLKGSGGGYGIQRLTDLGEILEAAGEKKDFDTAAETIEELADYLDNLEISYEEEA